MFEDFKKFETEIAGRPFVVEVGKMAQLAGGSCLVRYGETDVLCTATMAAKPREGVDFFPLSVDFEEALFRGQDSRLVPAPRGQSEREGYSCVESYRQTHSPPVPQGHEK